MFEVLSGEIPFHHLKGEPAVIQAVLSGVRPARWPTHSQTGESDEKLWKIAVQCWDEDPQRRPRMDDVYYQMCGSDGTSPQDASATAESGESSPTSSTASFVTALEEDFDGNSPVPDEITSDSGGISLNSLGLSLPEPGPSVVPLSFPPGVPRCNSLDTTEREWMDVTPVGNSPWYGQVKIPQGHPYSRGVLCEAYQCEARFRGDAAVRVVTVKVLRAVALEGSNDSQPFLEVMQATFPEYLDIRTRFTYVIAHFKENVLINESGDALIMGLGLAAANSSSGAEHLLQGIRWMPSELLLNGQGIPSCKTDVYSFGGVAIEV
ncbi:hypothetical protein FRC05_001479 [Tulasnella sp. 425]|nr:hypothetical protein FRC05_001479 [Tulasnella sp. 425]